MKTFAVILAITELTQISLMVVYLILNGIYLSPRKNIENSKRIKIKKILLIISILIVACLLISTAYKVFALKNVLLSSITLGLWIILLICSFSDYGDLKRKQDIESANTVLDSDGNIIATFNSKNGKSIR